MTAYFKPLRRKIGVATLVLSCVLATGWVRSIIVYVDHLEFGFGKHDVTICSLEGLVYWSHLHAEHRFIDYPFMKWNSIVLTQKRVSKPFYDCREFHWNLEAGDFRFTTATTDTPSEPVPNSRVRWRNSLTFGQLAYWSIVTPLTFLSAWLLLSKPRAMNPAGTTERSRQDTT